jgi:hypothetical protein
VSSTFFLTRERPASIEEVVAGLDRPGLRVADGELAALCGPWPDGSRWFYVPGRSSRGVEVRYEDGRFEIRLLSASTPEDYDLAFRILEVLGGTRPVQSEDGETTPADQLRARFGGDWMVRDMAAGITAIRWSLSTGDAVRIEGPVNAIEIAPGAAVVATDLLDALRRAQQEPPRPAPASASRAAEDGAAPQAAWERVLAGLADGAEEHEASLRTQENELAPAAGRVPVARSSRWRVLLLIPWLPVVLALLVPALAIRLLTVPFRGRIGQWQDLRRWRRQQRRRADLVADSEHLAHHPDDIDRRHGRAALLVRLGHPAIADRELGGCLEVRESAALYVDRARVRARLGLPHLARRDVERARSLGARPRRLRALAYPALLILATAAHLFVAAAGLDPD